MKNILIVLILVLGASTVNAQTFNAVDRAEFVNDWEDEANTDDAKELGIYFKITTLGPKDTYVRLRAYGIEDVVSAYELWTSMEEEVPELPIMLQLLGFTRVQILWRSNTSVGYTRYLD